MKEQLHPSAVKHLDDYLESKKSINTKFIVGIIIANIAIFAGAFSYLINVAAEQATMAAEEEFRKTGSTYNEFSNLIKTNLKNSNEEFQGAFKEIGHIKAKIDYLREELEDANASAKVEQNRLSEEFKKISRELYVEESSIDSRLSQLTSEIKSGQISFRNSLGSSLEALENEKERLESIEDALSQLEAQAGKIDVASVQAGLEKLSAFRTQVEQVAEADFLIKMEKRISDIETGISRHSPVGTIVSSLLNPRNFQRLAGDDWVLADGREVPEGSIISRIPDLRGVFLRGMNSGRDDGKEDPDGNGRIVGEFQYDEFKSHTHSFAQSIRRADHGFGGGPYSHPWELYGNGGNFLRLNSAGGSETRPKNVSVYFYIKVR